MRAKIVVLLVGLAIFSSGQAKAAIVTGNLYRIDDGSGNEGSTVDHWKIHVNSAGIVTIDVLSWEQDSEDRFNSNGDTGEFVDVNGDGEIAFFDPYIYLFNDDGSLDVGDIITSNDDNFSSTYGDGSIYGYDSFVSVNLAAGDYILAIGAFFLSSADAVGTSNFNGGFYPVTTNYAPNDHGDYQITFDGDLTVEGANAVPEPASLTLWGLGALGWAIGAYRRRRVA